MHIKLRVDRAKSEVASLASRSLIHIDPAVMDKYKLRLDEVVLISTDTARYSIPARIGDQNEEDRGSGLVRFDRFLRSATKAKINQPVEIQTVAAIPELESLTLMPPIDVSTAHRLIEHLTEGFIANRTPLGRGSIVYATFRNSPAGISYRVMRCKPEFGVVSEKTKI